MALQIFVRCLSQKPGQPSGDAFWYSEEPHHVWLMVVDGLGSGPEAAAPAQRAVDCVRKHVEEHGFPFHPAPEIESILLNCDRALRGSRGAAMGLAIFDAEAGFGYYGGIGNIEMRVLGSKAAHPPSQPGIVGAGVRKVRVEQFGYTPGDLIIMHSDGLSSRFSLSPQVALGWNLEVVGTQLVAEHGKAHDDMTIVLLRQYA